MNVPQSPRAYKVARRAGASMPWALAPLFQNGANNRYLRYLYFLPQPSTNSCGNQVSNPEFIFGTPYFIHGWFSRPAATPTAAATRNARRLCPHCPCLCPLPVLPLPLPLLPLPLPLPPLSLPLPSAPSPSASASALCPLPTTFRRLHHMFCCMGQLQVPGVFLHSDIVRVVSYCVPPFRYRKLL